MSVNEADSTEQLPVSETHALKGCLTGWLARPTSAHSVLQMHTVTAYTSRYHHTSHHDRYTTPPLPHSTHTAHTVAHTLSHTKHTYPHTHTHTLSTHTHTPSPSLSLPHTHTH